MRWFLMSSSVLRGGNLVVTEEGIRESVRQVMLPLWSTWYFFSLYANTARPSTGPGTGGYEAKRRTDSTDVLDRYLLAKLRDLVAGVTADLEDFDSPLAAQKLRDFADVLTNWYVRRSRDRFWAGVGEDPATDLADRDTEAFDTLFTVLETFTRLAAPLLPLVSEKVWRGLTGGRSVHLADWPDVEEFPADPALVAAMDAVREISGATLALRKQAGRRVRLPLANLTVVTTDAAALAPFEGILRDELNVKSVDLVPLDESSAEAYGVTKRLSVNARAAGPRLGKSVQQAIQAARSGDWSLNGDGVVAGGIALEPGEYDLVLEAGGSADGSSALALLSDGGFVLLDTATTPELEAEGLARDVVRAVQEARKAAGLEVGDRIRLGLTLDETGAAAASAHHALIARETLASELDIEAAVDVAGATASRPVGDGSALLVDLEKL
jgi:isoleucyl-tRNA synthetase